MINVINYFIHLLKIFSTMKRVAVITCLRDNFQFVHEEDSGHV